MQIQVNTDRNIDGHRRLVNQVNGVVQNVLGELGEQITRIEVHLSDQNGGKGSQEEMRCMIEARLEGRRPTAVTCRAQSLRQAVDGAAKKLKHSIGNAIERRRHRQRN